MTDHATEQIALFMNARDNRDYGTAIWSELDIVGREAYLTDAAALVAAVKALGWAPVLTPTDDEREALADRLARRLIDDPEQLMLAEGTGALHVALSESIRSTIEDVYADCGDSDPGVLSSNIARRLAWDLPPAILSAVGFRRTDVPDPSAEGQGPAASCHLCVGAGGYEGHDGGWVECSCQRREPQGEPSDARAKVIDALVMTRLSDFAGTDMGVIEQAADAVLAALRAAGVGGA